MKLNEAIKKYLQWKTLLRAEKTISAYSIALRQFAIHCKNCDIQDVTVDHVNEWFLLMKDLDYDQNSFLPKASAVKSFFLYFKKQNLNVLDPDLVPVPRKTYKELRTLSEGDYQLILDSIETIFEGDLVLRVKATVGLLWDTGVRIGELAMMNHDELDIPNRSAIVATKKSRGSRPFRRVFWSRETNVFLKEWLNVRPDTHKTNALLVSLDRNHKGSRLTTRSLQRDIKQIIDTCGLEGITPHKFRHSKAHNIIKRGGSGADVMNILGHSNINSSSRYVEMAGNELEDRAKKFL
jgi:site-specific recombinase XerD